MKKSTHLTRREFLRLAAMASGSALLSACQQALPTPLATLTPTLLPSSTPIPTVTATRTSTATATPKPLTLRDVGEKLGVYITTTVDGAEEWRYSRYINAARDHFSGLFPSGSFMQSHFDTYGMGTAQEFRRRALIDNQILHIHPGFWHQDVKDSLKNASDNEIKSFMQQPVRSLLGFVGKVESGAKPTYINFFNEAFWYVSTSRFGWEQSPYRRIYGDSLITETYLLFAQIAAEFGLQIGRDFRMIYNDYDIYSPGGKTDFVFDVLSRSKRQIAERLGVTDMDVQLDIGIQHHLFLSKRPLYWREIPDQEQLKQAYQRLAQIGRVHVTELDVRGASDQTEITEKVRQVTRTAIKSGVCDSINYWYCLRVFETAYDKAQREKGNEEWFPLGLFDRSYNPTNAYMLLLHDLEELLAEKNKTSQPNATATPRAP